MLALIRWLARRRLATLHAWGALLGWLGYALSPSYRRRLVRHAKLAGLDGPKRRAAVAQAGRMVVEMPWLWLRPPSQPLGDLVHWEGASLIQAAIRKGATIQPFDNVDIYSLVARLAGVKPLASDGVLPKGVLR